MWSIRSSCKIKHTLSRFTIDPSDFKIRYTTCIINRFCVRRINMFSYLSLIVSNLKLRLFSGVYDLSTKHAGLNMCMCAFACVCFVCCCALEPDTSCIPCTNVLASCLLVFIISCVAFTTLYIIWLFSSIRCLNCRFINACPHVGLIFLKQRLKGSTNKKAALDTMRVIRVRRLPWQTECNAILGLN